MSHKQHFDSIARRPAAEQPAAIHAETGPATTTENKVKVVHHFTPGFARPQ